MSAAPARDRARKLRAKGYMHDIELSLPLQLLKAREAAMARFRPMLRSHGLTEQQWRVIRVLAATDDIDGRELARRSFLLAPSLTRILQNFEAMGMVRRGADASDQRRAPSLPNPPSRARGGSKLAVHRSGCCLTPSPRVRGEGGGEGRTLRKECANGRTYQESI